MDGATGRVLTYAQLAGSVRRAAAGLVARGVAQGGVLALCSPNCPEPSPSSTQRQFGRPSTIASKPAGCGRGRCQPTCADATAERPVNTQRGPRGGAPTDWFTRHPADPGSGLLRATVEGRTDDTFRYGTVAVDLLVIRSVMARTAHWSTRPARPAVASTSRSWPAQPGHVGRVRQVRDIARHAETGKPAARLSRCDHRRQPPRHGGPDSWS